MSTGIVPPSLPDTDSMSRPDNEAHSADWACRIVTELGRPDEEQTRVRELIARAGILRYFLRPDRLFYTALYREHREGRARANRA